VVPALHIGTYGLHNRFLKEKGARFIFALYVSISFAFVDATSSQPGRVSEALLINSGILTSISEPKRSSARSRSSIV
jgi:hypothetical protein